MLAFKQKQRKKSIRRWISIALLLVIVAGGVWYFVFDKKDASAVTVYRFAAIEHGDIVKAITATGTIQATKTVQVGTQVSGVLGFNMLRILQIKIDYRDGLVDFLFDPKHLPKGMKLDEQH